MSQEYYAAARLFTMLCAGAYAKLFLIKDAQHDSKLQGSDYYEEVLYLLLQGIHNKLVSSYITSQDLKSPLSLSFIS